MPLHPVLLSVPELEDELPGKQRVARLSRLSREALRLSATRSGIDLGEIKKDEDDVPLPSNNGYHWSVSHKKKWVAAVVSRKSIGIDIEEIRPRSGLIYDVVASDEEWSLSQDKSWHTFFRYWTAKEAVLKAVGIGIGGLTACRIVAIPDETHVALYYKDCILRVAQLYVSNHIVSVLQNDYEIQWHVLDNCTNSQPLSSDNK